MRRKHWPRHGGLGLGLGVGGGGVGYLLNDSFLTARLAGAVHGTAAEPGPGTRSLQDATAIISIASGYMSSSAGAVGNTNPNRNWGVITRAKGRILISKFRLDNNGATAGPLFGIYTDNDPGSYVNQEGGVQLVAATGHRLLYGSSTIGYVDNGVLATLYSHCFILKENGFYYLNNVDGMWYLRYIYDTGNTASLYPSFSAIANGFHEVGIDFIRVPTMLWTPRPISADAFGGTWPTTDGGGLTGLEAGGSGKTWTTAVGATWSNALGFAVNAPVAGGTNLVTNPEFTTNTDSWAADEHGTITRKDFTAAPDIDPTGGADDFGVEIVCDDGTESTASQNVTIPLGVWHRISCRGYAPSSNTVERTAKLRYSTSALITVTSEDVWELLALTWRGTGAALLLSGRVTTATIGDVSYFDAFTVKPLTTAELIQVIDNGVNDFYAEIDITAVAGFQAGIVFNYTDASNFEVVYLNRNGNKVYWDQCLLGTYTNINTSVAVTPGAGYKLAVRRIGTSVYYWYNNIYVHNNTIVSTLNTTSQGLFSTGNGATEVKFDNWKLYAVGSGGEYSLLDMFCN